MPKTTLERVAGVALTLGATSAFLIPQASADAAPAAQQARPSWSWTWHPRPTKTPTPTKTTTAPSTSATPTSATPSSANPSSANPTSANPSSANPTSANPTSATPTAPPTNVTPTPTSPSGYTEQPGWEASVLSRLNSERAANKLPPLTINAKLHASASTHNLAMAQANTLSHQLSGEASLGTRVTNAGYVWSSCGENIAWNSQRSEVGVLAVQDSMYNETPPNDGHRQNILSSSFTEVGIDVIDDSVHKKVWLTTDFGRPR